MIVTKVNRRFAKTFEFLDFYIPDFDIPVKLDSSKFVWQKHEDPQIQTHMDMYQALAKNELHLMRMVHLNTGAWHFYSYRT